MEDVRSKIRWLRLLPALGLTVVAVFVASAPQAQADAACAGRYSFPAPGTVLDNETKLVWQQEVDSTIFRNWGDAKAYCENLTLAGYSWELPTAFELQTLVDESRVNPAIDAKSFPQAVPNNFWSSTTYSNPTQAGKAWHVDFYLGENYVDDMTREYYVRCVKKKL